MEGTSIERAPSPGTLARWAWDHVLGTNAAAKLAPPAPPFPVEARAAREPVPAIRLAAPGRPAEWRVVPRHPRTPSEASLAHAVNRARLCLTFAHHEIQAGELMAWAILAFPNTPDEFREGLARLALDESRHARLYVEHARELGLELGEQPVRDWFWQRVPLARAPAEFVALLGVGFEGANLDHAARWAAAFRRAGDERGALLQEEVARDERAHVAFAARWFERFAGPLDFEAWVASLPAPLSPLVLRGKELAREARLAGGLSAAFVDALERWRPAEEATGSRAAPGAREERP